MDKYVQEAQAMFAFYGFVPVPLTEHQLGICYRRNIPVADTYPIGCDVNAGLKFNEALAINTQGE